MLQLRVTAAVTRIDVAALFLPALSSKLMSLLFDMVHMVFYLMM